MVDYNGLAGTDAFGKGYDQANGILSNYNNRKAALQAGDAYAGGNVTGAAGILARNGQIDQARTLNSDAADQAATAKKAQQEQAAHAVTAMVNMAQGLKQVPVEKRSEAFQKVIAPLLQQQGVDPAQIQQMSQADFSDQTLDTTIAALGQEGKKYQLANGGDGYFGSFDQSSGTLKTLREGQPSYQPVTVEDANGNKAVIPFNKNDPYGAGAAGTRGQRNNNPGNLKWDGRSKWQGMTGVDPQGFVIFDTPDNGVRAAGINLQTQASRGPQTLTSLITKYAPASDNNDTQAYIASVAQQTGLDPSAQIDLTDPNIRQKVMSAMFKVEGGGTPARSPSPPVDNGGLSPSNGMAPIYAAPGFGSGVDLKQQRLDAAQQKAEQQQVVTNRKEFDALPDVKNYNTVATAYNTIKKAAAGKSAADDIALIYSFMRVNDPTSVVRETEFATAQNMGGIGDNLINAANRALKGGRLNDQQRDQFVKTAAKLHEAQRERYDEVVSQYRGYEQESGRDPSKFKDRANPDADRGVGGHLVGTTPAAQAAFKQHFKPGAPRGSEQAPYMVRDDKDFNNLKSGEHFIDPNGNMRVKP